MTIEKPNHKTAIEFFLGWLSQQADVDLVAVGHRVVHGGTKYAAPVLITDDVINDLISYQTLAPLHQLLAPSLLPCR